MTLHNEFLIQNKKDWKKIHNSIFGDNVPSQCTWTNRTAIIDVLNKIGKVENSNHMFFPNGGGLDLLGASISHEIDCIELHTGVNRILHPKSLTFNYVDSEYEWNYFRLETNKLNSTEVYEDLPNDSFSEDLTELYPLNYVSRVYWDEAKYDEEDLPPSARLVVRVLKGSFVIFKKTSIYNRNLNTYDAIHETLSAEGFNNQIKNIYNQMKNKNSI